MEERLERNSPLIEWEREINQSKSEKDIWASHQGTQRQSDFKAINLSRKNEEEVESDMTLLKMDEKTESKHSYQDEFAL